MKKTFMSFCLCLLGLTAGASGGYTAAIGSVDTAGYYNICLTPQAVALGAPDGFRNFRIRDGKGAEVPFFVHADDYVKTVNAFVHYPLIMNQARDSVNILVVGNSEKRDLERLFVEVHAAEVSKQVVVRGSNNAREWYVVKGKGPVSNRGFFSGSHEYLEIDIPKGNYPFYEITLTNSQSSPLEVLRVGDFKSSRLYSSLVKYNPGPAERSDSLRQSRFCFPDAPHRFSVSRMAVHVSDRFHYLRKGYIESPEHGRRQGFVLSSDKANVFVFDPMLFGPRTRIVIENQDNRPLQIDSVELFGLNRYLCAYLEPGGDYTMVIDTTGGYSVPDYDIARFREEIGAAVPQVGMAALERCAVEATAEESPRFFETAWFLWSVIVLVGAGLVVMCFRVVREMNDRK